MTNDFNLLFENILSEFEGDVNDVKVNPVPDADVEITLIQSDDTPEILGKIEKQLKGLRKTAIKNGVNDKTNYRVGNLEKLVDQLREKLGIEDFNDSSKDQKSVLSDDDSDNEYNYRERMDDNPSQNH
tara:strand:+ start:107 stop:490 length:384 start_codon:yes stop_codon:yes gene_type:complete